MLSVEVYEVLSQEMMDATAIIADMNLYSMQLRFKTFKYTKNIALEGFLVNL